MNHGFGSGLMKQKVVDIGRGLIGASSLWSKLTWRLPSFTPSDGAFLKKTHTEFLFLGAAFIGSSSLDKFRKLRNSPVWLTLEWCGSLCSSLPPGGQLWWWYRDGFCHDNVCWRDLHHQIALTREYCDWHPALDWVGGTSTFNIYFNINVINIYFL